MSQNSKLDLGPGNAEPLVLVALPLPLYSLVCKVIRLWVKPSVFSRRRARMIWNYTILYVQLLALQHLATIYQRWLAKISQKQNQVCMQWFKPIKDCNSPRISRSIQHCDMQSLSPRCAKGTCYWNTRNVRSKNRACTSLHAAIHDYSSSAG